MLALSFWIGDGPSVPCGDIARCNKGCKPPYHLGLGQEWRVTLIRHDDDFELTTACQHRSQSSRGQTYLNWRRGISSNALEVGHDPVTRQRMGKRTCSHRCHE